MKYTKEITDKLILDYRSGVAVAEIATELDVPERSVIAKLSSLGVYTKKSYVNKRGEIPVKKSEHIERIAQLLEVDEEMLESLEKVNKTVLKLIEQKLSEADPKLHKPIHILFRDEPDRTLHLAMNGAITAISNLGFRVVHCTSWDEFTAALTQYPHQVVAHIDTISREGQGVAEFLARIEKLIKMQTVKHTPLAIVIEKDTSLTVVEQLQKSTVLGIIPGAHSFGMHEGMQGVHALVNRHPNWPEHILRQLNSSKEDIFALN